MSAADSKRPSRAKRPPAAQRGAKSVKAKAQARKAALAAVGEARVVALVMGTSRYTGIDGRPVPRNRVAMASPAKAGLLIRASDAREATEAEVEAARAGRGVLELAD